MLKRISRPVFPAVVAAVSSSLIATHGFALNGPAYNIYPISPIGTDSLSIVNGISQSGNYADGFSQGSNASSAILYNTSSGSTGVGSQAGMLNLTTGTSTPAVNWAQPYSVTNSGLLWGTSGTGPESQGTPTVWKPVTTNGVTTLTAFNLYPPSLSNAGQVFGSNNNNMAVGVVGSNTGGLNQAAVFHFDPTKYSTNPTTRLYNYATDLTEQTPNGGTLQTAYGINDSNQVVGVANDPNNAALYVPFLLDMGTQTVSIIPTSNSTLYNGAIPFAISDSGYVTGSEALYGSGGVPFLYNINTNTTIAIPLVAGASIGSAKGVNDSGEVVGSDSGAYSLPYLYDGTNSYLLGNLLANNTSGAWHLSDNTSSNASAIADNGDIVGRAYYNGVLTAYIAVPTGSTIAQPVNITFNNTGGTGDGTTWDTVQQNFNNGSAPTTFNGYPGDYVTFNDANNGHYNVSIPATVTPSTTTINSSGNYLFTGAGGIGGTNILYKFGTGTLTLDNINTYTGPTNVDGGTLVLAVNGALPSKTSLEIYGTGSTVIVSSLGAAYALKVQSLGISNGDTLDVTNNDLIIHSGYLPNIFSALKNGYNGGGWNGSTGIISSMAGASHPLMALGVLANDNGSGTPLYGAGGLIASTFGGAVPVDGDILVKYTYYGDANLDGQVDGSDYTKIDAAYPADAAYFSANPTGTAAPLTGWLNGDFNYDGRVDGSDYTLIDNAFNTQGAVVATLVAADSTAQIAGAPVPEPASLAVIGILAGTLLRRRRSCSF